MSRNPLYEIKLSIDRQSEAYSVFDLNVQDKWR